MRLVEANRLRWREGRRPAPGTRLALARACLLFAGAVAWTALAAAAEGPGPEDLTAGWVRRITGEEPEPVEVTCADPDGFRLGRAVDGGPIRRAGRDGFGLGARTGRDLIVTAPGGLRRFVAVAVIDQDDETMRADAATVPVIFSVLAGGREVWRSPPTIARMDDRKFGVEFPAGTTSCVLRATLAEANAAAVNVDWAEAEVELTDGRKVPLGRPDFPAQPFSFVYDGRRSTALLPGWKFGRTAREAPGETCHDLRWRDDVTGLECRLELRAFHDFPALEWVLYFRNTGDRDTPLLEQIQALDTGWEIDRRSTPRAVYRSRGSDNHIDDFAYEQTPLFAKGRIAFGADSGRSSRRWLPFFNTELERFGVITAVGWTGQWTAVIDREAPGQLWQRAGMERTHLRLRPGEEIRTPRILQLFWQGDRIAGHNRLRRFLLAHHSPQIDGRTVTPPFSLSQWGGTPTRDQLALIARAKAERATQDHFWVDAGWYGPASDGQDWSEHVGDWRMNRKLHPDGLRPIADAAAAAGMKFLLWVEPERAMRGTPWPAQHPDWFLGYKERLLLDLGNAAARQGAVELLAKLIRENRVAVFRDDLNMDCLESLRLSDTADRQGIAEIRYVTGLYAFWDELRAGHPGLIIDNCGSGGQRIDLETISRSVALWRSDYPCDVRHDPRGPQAQGLGLSYWIPLHGTGANWGKAPAGVTPEDWRIQLTYRVRSAMGPAFVFAPSLEPEFSWDWWRKMSADYLRARPLFTGDYYPLTEFAGTETGAGVAYQMHRPDRGEGFVMAFRRKDTPWEAATFPLRGLEPEATYELEDADTGMIALRRGRELAAGLRVVLPIPESSALFFYRRTAGAP